MKRMPVAFFHFGVVTSRRIMLTKLSKIHLYYYLDFSGKLYCIFYVFIFPLLPVPVAARTKA
jgi:hypothetical protein